MTRTAYTPKDVYATRAISQLPRILGNMDRNPFSKTYGCMHRDYWMDKTSDFPDAVRQFAVHALALAYKYDFPGSIYRGTEKTRDWAIAGMHFWAKIQHREGSFDEFYPFERGWVGPTAFTTYAVAEAYNLLKPEIPDAADADIRAAISKAAHFIARGESEKDDLANHHAMACLSVWKAARLLDDPALMEGYQRLWKRFLTYHKDEEGWSLEYDGIDPGYLSATVSFLAKIYRDNPNRELFNVLKKSIETCSYFVYPNGSYGGSAGSRNTQHFYPHGFEIMAGEVPAAGTAAEEMLNALERGRLVPPEIISDRYLVYRVPEYLLSYLDYKERDTLTESNSITEQPVPYAREAFTRHFSTAGISIVNTDRYYAVCNLARGGVIKVFDKNNKQLIFNDSGWIGKTAKFDITTQWIDPGYRIETNGNRFTVSGSFHKIPSGKVFNIKSNLVFRIILLMIGWSPHLAHWFKGQIRRMLMLGQRPAPLTFVRAFIFDRDEVTVTDTVRLQKDLPLEKLMCGGEHFVRYVPQSRYFQAHDLDMNRSEINIEDIDRLNEAKRLSLKRIVDLNNDAIYQDLQFSSGSVDDNKQNDYWENISSRRDPRHPAVISFAQPKINLVKEVTGRSGESMLEVGCGSGYLTVQLNKIWSVTGLDLSARMLELNPHGDKVQGSVENLPFEDNSFDIVICANLLHHLADPRIGVSEMCRVAKTNVVIIEPNRDNFLMFLFSMFKKVERGALKFSEKYVAGLVNDCSLEVLFSCKQGSVVPNKTPAFLVPVLDKFNGINPLGFYTITIARKSQGEPKDD